MKSLWPEKFSEDEMQTPKEILDQQVKLLPKLTGDLVYGEVNELSANNSFVKFHGKSFNFGLSVGGKFIENYQFRVFSFAHDIIFYPVILRLDSDIAKELEINKSDIAIKNEDEFITLLEKIFNSDKIKKVVGSLIKLSK